MHSLICWLDGDAPLRIVNGACSSMLFGQLAVLNERRGKIQSARRADLTLLLCQCEEVTQLNLEGGE